MTETASLFMIMKDLRAIATQFLQDHVFQDHGKCGGDGLG